MRIRDVGAVLAGFDGVREKSSGGLTEWRYHGRLVARQLDETHVVIRADFDYRDAITHEFGSTFEVPDRFAKHMMVVADLGGDRDAVEEALAEAWRLQRAAD